MGQPVSKPGTTAPFENYQVYTGQAGAGGVAVNPGPALPPPSAMYVNNDFAAPSQIGYSGPPIQPSRRQLYRAPRGGPMPQGRPQPRQGYNYPPGDDGMDDMGFFQDDDNMSGMADPRFYPQGGGGGGGMARDMINDIRQQTQQRINPARAQNYRNMPPPQQQQAFAQPKITRYRTVVDEPRGYVPPTQAGQGYGQGYASQPVVQQSVPVQQQQGNITPQQVTLYYDPQTGAIQNPNQTATTAQYGLQQNAAPAQQPMYLSYQQPTGQAAQPMAYQQPVAGYQQAAPVGYQQAVPAAGYQTPMGYGMPQGYMMMPQYGMPQQHTVIPAQVISK